MEHTSIEDPTYRAAVVDLLGVLAYGELSAFSSWPRTPTSPRRCVTSRRSRCSPHECVKYSVLTERLQSLGVEPETAMEPFVGPSTRSTSARPGLPRGTRQGLRRRGHRPGLLPRDLAVRRRRHPRARRQRPRGHRSGRLRRHRRARGHRRRPPPAAGSRCGAVASSARPSPRHSASASSATPCSILVGAPGRWRRRPRRGRPDVRPAHRRALPPDGATGPVGLTDRPVRSPGPASLGVSARHPLAELLRLWFVCVDGVVLRGWRHHCTTTPADRRHPGEPIRARRVAPVCDLLRITHLPEARRPPRRWVIRTESGQPVRPACDR